MKKAEYLPTKNIEISIKQFLLKKNSLVFIPLNKLVKLNNDGILLKWYTINIQGS